MFLKALKLLIINVHLYNCLVMIQSISGGKYVLSSLVRKGVPIPVASSVGT